MIFAIFYIKQHVSDVKLVKLHMIRPLLRASSKSTSSPASVPIIERSFFKRKINPRHEKLNAIVGRNLGSCYW